MQLKQILRWSKFIIVSTIIAFSVLVICIPANSSLVNLFQSVSLRERAPTRLLIPVLKVDAAIERVGLTPEGAMAAPKDPADVAWFTLGPRPGEVGSAVVSGHFGWKDNIPAVFDELHLLKKGDKIIVENNKGERTTFVVRESRVYGEHDDASDVFSSSDAMAHLNLITCEGVWDAVSKSYSKRLVVFTDKE